MADTLDFKDPIPHLWNKMLAALDSTERARLGQWLEHADCDWMIRKVHSFTIEDGANVFADRVLSQPVPEGWPFVVEFTPQMLYITTLALEVTLGFVSKDKDMAKKALFAANHHMRQHKNEFKEFVAGILIPKSDEARQLLLKEEKQKILEELEAAGLGHLATAFEQMAERIKQDETDTDEPTKN